MDPNDQSRKSQAACHAFVEALLGRARRFVRCHPEVGALTLHVGHCLKAEAEADRPFMAELLASSQVGACALSAAM